MSLLAEKALVGLLTDVQSIESLVQHGLDMKTIATQRLHPVVSWALNYYMKSAKAPSVAAIREHYGDLLTDLEVQLDGEGDFEVAESMEWAIDTLTATYIRGEAATVAREMLTEITAVEPDERIQVLGEYSSRFVSLNMSLQPRTTQVDMRSSGDRMLSDYDAAVARQGQVLGMAFGLELIDGYTHGIWPGELAVIAAPAKMGKSWFMNFIAYQCWKRGRICATYTLENSIQMTQMRIACIANNISIQQMQDGTLPAVDYEKLRWWCNDELAKSDVPFPIFNPTTVNRTPQAIVQAALAHGAVELAVDQLTFVNPGESRNRNRKRNEEIGEMMRDFKTLISTGRHQMSLALAHQINRDGIKSAIKTGKLHMTDMAEGADVERTADWVFGLYASDDQRAVDRMQMQTLAVRRAPARDFDLLWQIETGVIRAVSALIL